MEILHCDYCSLGYDFAQRLPISFDCGHTYCLNCYKYFIDLLKQSFCPFCNILKEPECYDQNVLDSLRRFYLCLWHKLPIKYSNKEKAFACQACKDESPNLEYDPWTINNKGKVIEQMENFSFESEIGRNVFIARKHLEENLERSRGKKIKEIEKIKKEYKDQKAEIRKHLKLLDEISRKYTENNEYFDLQFNLNLICLLTQKKAQKYNIKPTFIEENLSENRINADYVDEFQQQSKEWVDLWDRNIFILYKSFSRMKANFEISIKKKILISLNEQMISENRPRNLSALGLCLPINEDGVGEYTILGIEQIIENENENEIEHVSLLSQLNPIRVGYDSSNYVSFTTLPQEVILFEGLKYLLTYEYFGSPTYLGVVPMFENDDVVFAGYDSLGKFVCTESQIVYLIIAE